MTMHTTKQAKANQISGRIMTESFGDGSRVYQRVARRILPILVATAKAGRDINGSLLAKKAGVHLGSIRHPLAAIGYELHKLGQEWQESIPPIHCLVVSEGKAKTRLGINLAMPHDQFRKLTPLAKEQVLTALCADIWSYAKWDAVLQHFKLNPVATEEKHSEGGAEKHRSR